ncbi:ROK family protein [Nocardia sp. NPDC004722]
MPMTKAEVVTGGAALGKGALLQMLRDGRPRTKAELSAETGLARSTVIERLDALLASGFVQYVDKAGSTGGRPPSMIAFNSVARVILAADVGATHVRLAVTDLNTDVLAEVEYPIDIAEGPDAVLTAITGRGAALLAEIGRVPTDLLGVGVGLPGPVDHIAGRPVNPPIMPGWDGFAVKDHLERQLGVVSLVDNDVNLMALGEHRTQWPDDPNMIFVKVATGIGCGLISDGHLHRGARGAAGDLGHVRVPHDTTVVCRCGNIGCLEAIAGGSAVARKLTELGTSAASSSDVITLTRGGSVDALRVLRQAGRDIGEVLATAVNLFNPSVIAIGGSLSQAGDHLLAGIREVVYRRSLPLATDELRIVSARAGARAGIVGAAAIVVDHALSPGKVDRLLAG